MLRGGIEPVPLCVPAGVCEVVIAFKHLGCWRSCADVEAVMLLLDPCQLAVGHMSGVDSG
jgi:hypothetical protein